MINLARQAFANPFMTSAGASFQPGLLSSVGRCPTCGNAIGVGGIQSQTAGLNPWVGGSQQSSGFGLNPYSVPPTAAFGQFNPLASQFTSGTPQGINPFFGQQFTQGIPQGINPLVGQQFSQGVPQGISPFAGQQFSQGVPQGISPYAGQQFSQGIPQGINPLVGQQFAQGIPQSLNPFVGQLGMNLPVSGLSSQWAGGRAGSYGVDPRQAFGSQGQQFGYNDPYLSSTINPLGVGDPISSLLQQQLNPLSQQQLPIRPLIGGQQGTQSQWAGVNPFNQWVDPYRAIVEAQLISQLAANPLYQRAYGVAPEVMNPGFHYGAGQQFNPLFGNVPF